MSTCPLNAASISGVNPKPLPPCRAFTGAPCSRSRRAMGTERAAAAEWRGITCIPFEEAVSTLAPCSSNTRTAGSWPKKLARPSGPKPSLDTALATALARRDPPRAARPSGPPLQARRPRRYRATRRGPGGRPPRPAGDGTQRRELPTRPHGARWRARASPAPAIRRWSGLPWSPPSRIAPRRTRRTSVLEEVVALGHGQDPRRLAGQELAVRAHLVGLRVDLHPREIGVVDHVGLREPAAAAHRGQHLS